MFCTGALLFNFVCIKNDEARCAGGVLSVLLLGGGGGGGVELSYYGNRRAAHVSPLLIEAPVLHDPRVRI